jgi:hypothetical protein
MQGWTLVSSPPGMTPPETRMTLAGPPPVISSMHRCAIRAWHAAGEVATKRARCAVLWTSPKVRLLIAPNNSKVQFDPATPGRPRMDSNRWMLASHAWVATAVRDRPRKTYSAGSIMCSLPSAARALISRQRRSWSMPPAAASRPGTRSNKGERCAPARGGGQVGVKAGWFDIAARAQL